MSTLPKTSAVLLMTGHTLTLLFNGQPVAGCVPDKRSIANLKGYIAARRGEIEFSNDNMISFPWLRDLMAERCNCGSGAAVGQCSCRFDGERGL
jgi:hypothetical protein